MARLIATVASLFFAAQTALPLALACCEAPSAHECCATAQARQSSDPALGRAPCCRSEAKAVSAGKDEALNASVTRAWFAAPVVAPLKMAVVLVEQIVPRPDSTLRVLRALGPPVPLRI